MAVKDAASASALPDAAAVEALVLRAYRVEIRDSAA